MAGNAINARLIETLQVLAGDRPRNQQDAAVRHKDLEKILNDFEARILEKIRKEIL